MTDGMEFGRLSKVTLGEAVTTVATEGGSIVAGLFGAGILGKMVEKNLGTVGSKAALPTSTVTDKVIAWTANNAPKVAAWYLLKKEGKLGGYEKDIEKGIVASVVLDTVVRASNSFAPKPMLTIAGFDLLSGEKVSSIRSANPQLQAATQQLIQENSTLRGQLNQALGKLASMPTISVTPLNGPSVSQSTDRQKHFGAMVTPSNEERQRKFGAMGDMTIDGSRRTLGAMYGFD